MVLQEAGMSEGSMTAFLGLVVDLLDIIMDVSTAPLAPHTTFLTYCVAISISHLHAPLALLNHCR